MSKNMNSQNVIARSSKNCTSREDKCKRSVYSQISDRGYGVAFRAKDLPGAQRDWREQKEQRRKHTYDYD
jgi:hypothetical protein